MEQEEISNSGDDDDDENGGSPPREEIPCMFAACNPIQMVLPSLDGTAICASCLIDSAITDLTADSAWGAALMLVPSVHQAEHRKKHHGVCV